MIGRRILLSGATLAGVGLVGASARAQGLGVFSAPRPHSGERDDSRREVEPDGDSGTASPSRLGLDWPARSQFTGHDFYYDDAVVAAIEGHLAQYPGYPGIVGGRWTINSGGPRVGGYQFYSQRISAVGPGVFRSQDQNGDQILMFPFLEVSVASRNGRYAFASEISFDGTIFPLGAGRRQSVVVTVHHVAGDGSEPEMVTTGQDLQVVDRVSEQHYRQMLPDELVQWAARVGPY